MEAILQLTSREWPHSYQRRPRLHHRLPPKDRHPASCPQTHPSRHRGEWIRDPSHPLGPRGLQGLLLGRKYSQGPAGAGTEGRRCHSMKHLLRPVGSVVGGVVGVDTASDHGPEEAFAGCSRGQGRRRRQGNGPVGIDRVEEVLRSPAGHDHRERNTGRRIEADRTVVAGDVAAIIKKLSFVFSH